MTQAPPRFVTSVPRSSTRLSGSPTTTTPMTYAQAAASPPGTPRRAGVLSTLPSPIGTSPPPSAPRPAHRTLPTSTPPGAADVSSTFPPGPTVLVPSTPTTLPPPTSGQRRHRKRQRRNSTKSPTVSPSPRRPTNPTSSHRAGLTSGPPTANVQREHSTPAPAFGLNPRDEPTTGGRSFWMQDVASTPRLPLAAVVSNRPYWLDTQLPYADATPAAVPAQQESQRYVRMGSEESMPPTHAPVSIFGDDDDGSLLPRQLAGFHPRTTAPLPPRPMSRMDWAYADPPDHGNEENLPPREYAPRLRHGDRSWPPMPPTPRIPPVGQPTEPIPPLSLPPPHRGPMQMMGPTYVGGSEQTAASTGERPNPPRDPFLPSLAVPLDQRLSNPAALGLTPTPRPPRGFPSISFRDPESLYAGLSAERVSVLRNVSPVVLIHVWNVRWPTAEQRRTITNTLAAMVRTVFREVSPWVIPPAAEIDANGVQLTSPYTWVLTDVSDGTARGLITYRIWSFNNITFFCYPRPIAPSTFLFSLVGFDDDRNGSIRQAVVDVFESPQLMPRTLHLIRTNPDFDGMDAEDVARALVNTIRVVVLNYNNGNLVANVYCESPTSSITHWRSWRDAAAELTYSTPLSGVGRWRAPWQCQGCHADDHPTHLCPFPHIPGWNGPAAGSNMYAQPSGNAGAGPSSRRGAQNDRNGPQRGNSNNDGSGNHYQPYPPPGPSRFGGGNGAKRGRQGK
ncbi:hypothetical protein FKP32DRAFT_1606028 [Trametes sanguinea]|nr:hypothetical protein FKP32DRAFT_1606028 [Trametes sanguinea]